MIFLRLKLHLESVVKVLALIFFFFIDCLNMRRTLLVMDTVSTFC